jgi:hypothetical protein
MTEGVLVGAYTTDITPELNAGPADDPPYERFEDYVLEPLLASVLTIRCSESRLVLVAVDCLGLSYSAARDLRAQLAIVAETTPQMVHVCASGTPFATVRPTSPLPDRRAGVSYDRLAAACERAAGRAIETECVSVMEVGSVRTGDFVAEDSRVQGEGARTRVAAAAEPLPSAKEMKRMPDPLHERPLTVIGFTSGDRVVATLVHFACPPVCGHGESPAQLSSDYVHYLRRTIQGELEGPVLFLQGAALGVRPASNGPGSRLLLGRGLGSMALMNRPSFDRVSMFDCDHSTETATMSDDRPSSAVGIAAVRLGPVGLALLPSTAPASFALRLHETHPWALAVTRVNGAAEWSDENESALIGAVGSQLGRIAGTSR